MDARRDRAGRPAVCIVAGVLLLSGCGATIDRLELGIPISPPEWRVGYAWHYERTLPAPPGTRRGVSYQVVRTERHANEDFYVLAREGRDYYYSTLLGYRMTRDKGNTLAENIPTFPALDGLWKGERAWSGELRVVRPGRPDRPIRTRSEIVGWEEVKVPAGTFRALRILNRQEDPRDPRFAGTREYWYAPAAKWVVKEIVKFPEAQWIDELKSFPPD